MTHCLCLRFELFIFFLLQLQLPSHLRLKHLLRCLILRLQIRLTNLAYLLSIPHGVEDADVLALNIALEGTISIIVKTIILHLLLHLNDQLRFRRFHHALVQVRLLVHNSLIL